MADRWEYIHADLTVCGHGPDPESFEPPETDVTPGGVVIIPQGREPRCLGGLPLGWVRYVQEVP